MSLQPLKQADALSLDSLLIQKVHEALGFPFRPNSLIATLPINMHGFGFPSIAHINASLVTEGIMRDLNHHLPIVSWPESLCRIGLVNETTAFIR